MKIAAWLIACGCENITQQKSNISLSKKCKKIFGLLYRRHLRALLTSGSQHSILPVALKTCHTISNISNFELTGISAFQCGVYVAVKYFYIYFKSKNAHQWSYFHKIFKQHVFILMMYLLLKCIFLFIFEWFFFVSALWKLMWEVSKHHHHRSGHVWEWLIFFILHLSKRNWLTVVLTWSIGKCFLGRGSLEGSAFLFLKKREKIKIIANLRYISNSVFKTTSYNNVTNASFY